MDESTAYSQKSPDLNNGKPKLSITIPKDNRSSLTIPKDNRSNSVVSSVSLRSGNDVISVVADKEMQLVGKAIRHVYSPTKGDSSSPDESDEPVPQERRLSRAEVLHQLAESFDKSPETLMSPVLKLKRSKSWTKESSFKPVQRTLTRQRIAPTINEYDAIIFSAEMGKRNRRGNYQNRIVRFDGFTFVCLSEKKLPTIPRNRPIIEFDLLESVDGTVQNVLGPLLKNTYPVGTQLPSMSNALIAESVYGSRPDIRAKRYHIPKVFALT